MSETAEDVNPGKEQPKAKRDEASPAWSQERAFVENLLCQRFNFFLVFFSLVVAGSLNARTRWQLRIVLGIGLVICWVLASVLARAQQKLDIILNDHVFNDATHPATIVNNEAGKDGGRRRRVGIWIPRICWVFLLLYFLLSWCPAFPGQAI